MHNRFILIICGLMFLIGVTTTVNATTIAFNDFSDTSILTLNGSATTGVTGDGAVLRLTPALANRSGSAFSSATISASTFSTYFEFRITSPGGPVFDLNTINGADGLVFVVQSVSSSIGGAGEGIGYAGIGTSVGVEFDTWGNANNYDPSSNHIGINVNGNVNHGSGSPNTVNVGNDGLRAEGFDNGEIWYSWVDYDGTTLEVRLNDNAVRPGSAILSRTLDIPTILGVPDAYVGFTSGTGLDWGNHDILTWEYRDNFNPIDNQVPEPATVMLLGLGLLGIAGIGRRKI